MPTPDQHVSASEQLATVVDRIDDRDRTDPFRWLQQETDTHRARHHCWAYPYADGSVLGAVVAARRPRTVLELGTALGYTACWWASQGARVDTIENDPVHVQLARHHVLRASPPGRVVVHQGDFADAQPRLPGGYDVAFFDGYDPAVGLLTQLATVLAPEGIVVVTNLELDGGRAERAWRTHPHWTMRIAGDLALCARR